MSLKTILELLLDDTSGPTSETIPATLKNQIYGIIANCTEVVRSIEKLLDQHAGTQTDRGARWALTGRSDVSKLRVSLEAHKSALELALDLVTVYDHDRIRTYQGC